MKQTTNVLSLLAMIALALGLVVANIYWHLIHPDATETRLFLMYWRPIFSVIVAWLVAGYVYLATSD